MENLVDSDGRNRRALYGAEQNAAKGIANRLPIALFQRLQDKFSVVGSEI